MDYRKDLSFIDINKRETRVPGIRKYGIDRCIKKPEFRAYERAQQARARGRDAPVSTQTNMFGSSGMLIPARNDRPRNPPPARPGPLEAARINQITFEHAHLTQGRQPVDPFENTDSAPRDSYEPTQMALLLRISEKPELVEHYPHTLRFLEDTPLDYTQPCHVNAKTAMDRYLELTGAGQPNNLPQDMQDLHDRIDAIPKLSNRAKLILLMATFIPVGSYTTYNAIKDWLLEAGHKLPSTHITSALKKGMSYFALEEIPVHRIVKYNGDIGVRSYD
ncbi:hypothetical protein CC86DRAFT_460784 [Ophiobolus disseminans]|uniref:Methylated-DNA-[protein]-cysteine S-methyltransferase DNA binding domain-containing protein n=1 Tax=Ophiobolus disseminans TaxID=1469910 RepID=A0A6A6ZCX3_9PLEO|nr:hypothetical protein CC86DRAFT_460784 [Ophiobolus disseminans]